MEESEVEAVSLHKGPAATIESREQRFLEQHGEFVFRFRCEHCAHVIATTMKCSMGYPNPHLTGPLRGLEANGIPTSCKYWELSESA